MLKLSIPYGNGLTEDLTITSTTAGIPKNSTMQVRFLEKDDLAALYSDTSKWDANKAIFDEIFARYYGADSGCTEDQKKMLLVRMACEVIVVAYNTGETGKRLVETMFKHNVRIVVNFADTFFLDPGTWDDQSVIIWNPIWHGVVTEGIPKQGEKKFVRGIMSPLLALMHEMGHATQYREQNHYYMMKKIDDSTHWAYAIDHGTMNNNSGLKFKRRGAYHESKKSYPSTWLDEDNIKMNEFPAIEEINKYHEDNGHEAREPIRQEYKELIFTLYEKKDGQFYPDQNVFDDMNAIRAKLEGLLPAGVGAGLFVSSNKFAKAIKGIWRFISGQKKKPKCVRDVNMTAGWRDYFCFCQQSLNPHDNPSEEEKGNYCSFKERLDLEMDFYSKKSYYDKLWAIFSGSVPSDYKRKGKKHLGDAQLWYNAGRQWGSAMPEVRIEWEYIYQYMMAHNTEHEFDTILNEYNKKRTAVTSKVTAVSDIEEVWKDSLKFVSGFISGNMNLEKQWRPFQDTLQAIALQNINLHVDVGSNCNCGNIPLANWTFVSGNAVNLLPNARNILAAGVSCQWYLGVPSKNEMQDIIPKWGLTKSHLESKEFQALIERLFAVELMMPLVEEAFEKIRAVGDLGEALLEQDQRENVKFLVYPGAPGGMTPPGFAGPSGRNERGDNVDHSVIFWDPFSDFIYYAEDPDDAGKIYAERIPAWIVLGHELGHLRQFTTRPIWVKAVFKNNPGGETNPEKLYTGDVRLGRNLDYPHNIETYEHPLCDHGGFGKRQGYPAQNKQTEFPDKELNRDKSRDRLHVRRSGSLVDWSKAGVSDEDIAARKSVMDAAQIIANITKGITGHDDDCKLMERALSEDIYGSLKTQFRDLV
jgi:hypothetical protein